MAQLLIFGVVALALALAFVLINLTAQIFVFLGAIIGILAIAFVLIVVGLNFGFVILEGEKYTEVDRWNFASWMFSWTTPVFTFSRTEIEGLEKLDVERVKTGVIYPNHQSICDVFSLGKTIKRRHVYVAKKEVGEVFLLRRAMQATRCVLLDRGDPRAAVKSINEMVKVVREGILMVIFPEGTREIKAPMGTFKAGSFKVALKAKADIIPMTIFNSYEVAKRWPLPTTIKVKVHDPIPYEAYKDMGTHEIAHMVEGIVKKELV